MKLLILTQKVDINDDLLGFFHGWIKEFAKNCEQVIVICLEKNQYDLPENIKVLSLGKEEGSGKLKYIFRFYKYIWQEKKNYDKVFVHMNPEYAVMGGLFWRLMGKKIGLWYAHGHAPFSLKIAEKFTNIIFTSTKSGCRINSQKIKVVGQGIDVGIFKNQKLKIKNTYFKILTVGRISPVKDFETLIKAIEVLNIKKIELYVDIVGGAGLPMQKKYLENLKEIVGEKKLNHVIKFLGPIPNKDVLKYYQDADLFVNMSHTGSLDKVMIEAMACGLPVLTCNESMEEVLGGYRNYLMFEKKDFRMLSEKVMQIKNLEYHERIELGMKLRELVKKDHGLENLIKKILNNNDN